MKRLITIGFSLLAAACFAQQVVTNVTVGVADAGGGDNLYTSFRKLNTNDTFLENLWLRAPTNTWAGPTSSISLLTTHQYFSTLGHCSITGYTGLATGAVQRIWLSILNNSGSNVNLYLPAGTILPNGASSPVTLTNATETQNEIRVRPQVRSNAIPMTL